MFCKKWRLLFHRQSHRFNALLLSAGPITINRNSKDNSKPGLTPDGILYAGYRLDKKKAISKAGGQRYLTIKGHARPV